MPPAKSFGKTGSRNASVGEQDSFRAFFFLTHHGRLREKASFSANDSRNAHSFPLLPTSRSTNQPTRVYSPSIRFNEKNNIGGILIKRQRRNGSQQPPIRRQRQQLPNPCALLPARHSTLPWALWWGGEKRGPEWDSQKVPK